MFSPLVLQMIAVGEESGQVEQLLTDVAEFYEREVDYDLKTLSDKIEPILIVIMAVFVTILALGIFLPMWDMYEVQKVRSNSLLKYYLARSGGVKFGEKRSLHVVNEDFSPNLPCHTVAATVFQLAAKDYCAACAGARRIFSAYLK